MTLTPVVLTQPPSGSDDDYSTLEDQTLVIAPPGVLTNDSDADGDALTAQLISAPARGTLTLAADGSFTYVPEANFQGTVTFRYRVSDGTSTSEPVTVTIVIEPVNDAPLFTAGGDVTVPEDSGAYSASWATPISAGAGESQNLTFEIISNSNPALFSVAPTIAANGQLAFTVAPDANGSASIAVVLNDDGGTANGGVDASAPVTFTITVNAINDAPSFALPAGSTGGRRRCRRADDRELRHSDQRRTIGRERANAHVQRDADLRGCDAHLQRRAVARAGRHADLHRGAERVPAPPRSKRSSSMTAPARRRMRTARPCTRSPSP